MAFDFPSSPVLGQNYLSYIWNGYAWTIGNQTGGVPPAGDYVLKTGDVMSGFLTLNALPTQPLHAATKSYVDSITTNLPQGTIGQALVVGTVRQAGWGNPIEGGNF